MEKQEKRLDPYGNRDAPVEPGPPPDGLMSNEKAQPVRLAAPARPAAEYPTNADPSLQYPPSMSELEVKRSMASVLSELIAALTFLWIWAIGLTVMTWYITDWIGIH